MDPKFVVFVLVYLILVVVALASRPSTRRKLGLGMMPAGLIMAAAMHYIIGVGGFPANQTLTCGYWLVVGITGLVLVLTSPRGKEETKREEWTPRRLLKLLSSVKLAISLLAIIGVVLILATVIKSQAKAQRYIYHSWWFISLLALFCLNLLLCTAGRWSFNLKKLGTTVTHAGVMVMVIGVVAGAIWGERGFMQLYIGHADNTCYRRENEKFTLPFTAYLEDFKVERYRRRVRQRLVVQVMDRGLVRYFPVEVGRKFQVAGTPYSVTTSRYEPDFVILGQGVYGSRTDEPRNPAIQVQLQGGVENGTRWLFAKFPGMRQDPESAVRLFYQRTERIKAFKSKVRLFREGKLVASGTIEVNKPLKYKGYSIHQSDYDHDRELYSVLEVARDPGLRFVYIGFLIISGGVVFTFYFRPLLLKHARASAGAERRIQQHLRLGAPALKNAEVQNAATQSRGGRRVT